METEDGKASGDKTHSLIHPSRRQFLRLSALGALSSVGIPAMAEQLVRAGSPPTMPTRGNLMPGRIVICHDPEMEGHLPTINRDRVEEMVHRSVRFLADIGETGPAFESLFPGVHEGSTFAIKVNCIGPTCTRWEVARGVVSGLALMFGGTYDVSQVTVYDRDSLSRWGYTQGEFTFNGNYPLLSGGNNASNSGYTPVPGYHLSRYILNSDYLIDIPALKSHNDPYNLITVAMKNHYGSCRPSSLCGNIPGMLTLNADPEIKVKTCLVLTDGLRATYTGGPGGSPQNWNLYPESTPNTLFLTTDPVTNEYWARDLINAQRTAYGYPIKPCTWVEMASEAPYLLGVSDPAQMTVLQLDPIAVQEEAPTVAAGTFLERNVPNPFSQSTDLRFRLERPGEATIQIVDVSGRVVRRLGGRSFPGGYSEIRWDGRDASGRDVAPGVYLAQLRAGRQVSARRVIVAR
jgi:hypothetical protein